MNAMTTELLSALEFVAPFADKRGTIPITQCVLIDTTDNALRLTATNLECVGKASIKTEGAGGWSVAIPAGLFLRYLRTITAPVVTLECGNKHSGEHTAESERHIGQGLVISYGENGRANIQGMSAASFPDVPTPDDIAVGISGLRIALPRAIISISEEESRFTLNGALLMIGQGNQWGLCSTDGHRLGFQSLNIATLPDGVAKFPFRTLLSRKAIAHLIRAEVDAATIQHGANDLFFTLDNNREVITRKLTGHFPDYEKLIQPMPNNGTFDAKAMLAALNSVGNFTDPRSRAMRFLTTVNWMGLRGETIENGSAIDAIGMDWSGPDIEFSLSGSYLKQFLELVDGAVSFGGKDAHTQFRFEVPGWCYIVMPMRI